MGGDARFEGRKIAVSQQEILRQCRLAKQMVSMHHAIADSYRLKAQSAKLILLGSSVIFLVTSFADKSLFESLGLNPSTSKLIVKIASAVAFFSSTALLIIDWSGTAARHRDSANRFSGLLMKLRGSRDDSGLWPSSQLEELSAAYQQVNENCAMIPDKKFNSLKIKYLMKKEVSALATKHPGAPHLLLWLWVKWHGARSLLSREIGTEK